MILNFLEKADLDFYIFGYVSDISISSDHFKEIVKRGNNGKTKIIEDRNGYRYSFKYKKRSGEISWSCSKLTALNCRAYVHTKSDLIIHQAREHCHKP